MRLERCESERFGVRADDERVRGPVQVRETPLRLRAEEPDATLDPQIAREPLQPCEPIGAVDAARAAGDQSVEISSTSGSARTASSRPFSAWIRPAARNSGRSSRRSHDRAALRSPGRKSRWSTPGVSC